VDVASETSPSASNVIPSARRAAWVCVNSVLGDVDPEHAASPSATAAAKPRRRREELRNSDMSGHSLLEVVGTGAGVVS
jgi:hypothetical protein